MLKPQLLNDLKDVCAKSVFDINNVTVIEHHLLLFMNGFNTTEAAVFSCNLCFLRAFTFISLIIYKTFHQMKSMSII